jgi:hypothetical protein
MKTNQMKMRVLAVLIGSLASTAAFAQGGSTSVGRPMIEVAGGYEYQAMESYVDCVGDCSPAHRATDTSRSGGVLMIGIQGLRLSDMLQGGNGHYDVRFVPLTLTLDNQQLPNDFGRVQGVGQGGSVVRRMIGVLVEASVAPGNSVINLRGKLLQVDYSRDKGFWDWRALDASVGLRKVVMSGNGNVRFDIEVSVGAGIGGVHLNNLDELQAMLGNAPRAENAVTFDPNVAFRTGLRVGSFKIEFIAQGERRVDLTPESSQGDYFGRALSANSTHIVSALDAEIVIGHHGFDSTGSRLGIFANAAYEYDNLTLSNMFFGQNDAYRSFRLVGGLRGRF